MTFFRDLQKVLRENVRQYGMFIALLVIQAIFTLTTHGLFISSRNIVDLLNQTGYIAVLAVGMTLVIIIRHIDLSVGFLAGFLGAIAATMMVFWHWSVFATIPAVMGLGIVAGLLTAILINEMGIPAFVATLAGWLIYRGCILIVTEASGTIIIPDNIFNAIGNGFIPDIPGLEGFLPGVHKLTLLLGAVATVVVVFNAIRSRRNKQSYNFEVLPTSIFVLQLLFIAVLVAAITWTIAGYRGLSWTAVVMLVVVLVYNFIMGQTVLGRHVYAVGGNPEAAQLSGINVKRITYFVFASMGLLTALSGIMFASRLKSATTTAGTLFETDAIAAAYVGGVSAAGGVGSVVGSLAGALVMTSLTSGMNLMGIGIAYQYAVRGAVLAAAVIFDVATRRRVR